MPLIRTRADIDDLLDGPTPAEEKLLAACLTGKPCHLSDKVPPKGTPDRQVHIRADVLRYLITGGCAAHPVANWGTDLYGAHITGPLDLRLATAQGVTGLIRCRFDDPIWALQTKLQLLNLNGSVVPALNAQGAQVTGSVFLRNIKAKATVTINGATIGGQLSCRGATFNAISVPAFKAQDVKVTGSTNLEGVTATGEVSFMGAQIGGQLDCKGATFSTTEGSALTLQRAHICQGLIWRNVTLSEGYLSLSAAHVGDLVDDLTSWPARGRLILDGFTYDRITAAPTDAARRLEWLSKGSTWNGEFFPQPYTQLAKVLREMGHDGEARKVLARREQLIRNHIRKDARIAPDGDVSVAFHSLWRDIVNLLRWGFDLLLRWVVGYGHKPFLSLVFLLALIGVTVFPAHYAWEEGSFAPNSGPVLVSEDWQSYHTTEANPAQVWSGDLAPRGWAATADCRHWKDCAPGRDWETFNRYAYAVDVVIPIIDIGQTDAWAPSTTRGWWGQQLWWFKGVLSVFGWIVTALGAAAITGIIRRD
ncbi:MAG: hypothetical protein AAGA94_11680 [Pseudomonadota bacterium]